MTQIASWNSARDVWETEAVSLLSGRSDVFSETFPISGSMRNGVAYELPMSVPRMDASGSLFSQLGGKLLPSPVAQPSGNSPDDHLRKKPGREVVTDLAIIVENGLLESGGRLLPTPEAKLASSGPDYARMDRGGSGGHDLTTALHLLPTPKAGDADFGMPRTSGRPPEKSTHLMTRMEHTKPAESWGPYAAAIQRWESALGRPAPDPTELGPKGGRRLSSVFVEWLMGIPDGWVTALGLPRTSELRMLGNGVVTQQALAALRSMRAARSTSEGVCSES